MSFTYAMTGSMLLKGCTGVSYSVGVTFRYKKGSTVYLCKKARKGILEAVTIKKVLINGYWYVPIYVDTLNSAYAEDELCTHAQAVDAARTYFEDQIGKISAALDILCDV